MVNKVILIGNLGKDPEVRRLENGAVVAKFSVATNENYKDKTGEWQTLTEWHDVVVWRQLAERAEQQLKKGMTVFVEGKLSTRTWQDQEGHNRKTTEIVASYFRNLSGRKEEGGGFESSPQHSEEDYPASSGKSGKSNGDMPTKEPVESEMEDDLPF